MSFNVRAVAVSCLIFSVAACSAGNISAPAPGETYRASAEARVEPQDVAERLLTQLRDHDYAGAYLTLSTGQARDFAANGPDLMTNLQGANTLVREWSLEEPTYVEVYDQAKVVVSGTVTFEDGGTGRISVLMQALGLQADPWRIDEFELSRD